MITRNSGSRWPSRGVVRARRTRGWASQGPGPSSKRGGGFSSPGRFMMTGRLGRVATQRISLEARGGAGFGGLHALLDQAADGLELGVIGPGDPLEDAALAGGEDGAGLLEPAQGHVVVDAVARAD